MDAENAEAQSNFSVFIYLSVSAIQLLLKK